MHGETIASLGAAGAAIDKLVDLAETLALKPLRERAMAQYNAARARALVDASREYLYASISEAYATAEQGKPVSMETRSAAS